MKVSTRGRYALRVMVDLAEHRNGSYVPLRDVVKRQEISQKYLESIMAELSKSKLIDGQHGKGGGYRLNRNAEDYTVGEILRVTEGDLAPVSCLECNAQRCERAAVCRTLPMWTKFYQTVNDFFDGITLADLMDQTAGNDYII